MRGGWATDHDHDTGEVRGILCNECNLALGRMGDSLESVQIRARQLTAYLERANHKLCISEHGSRPLPLVHYIIVRADLPIGSQVAQVIHAAGESASPKPEPGAIAVALHAKDEHHLLEIASALAHARIPHHLVVEADAPYADQYMAIGVHPTTDRLAVRKVLSALPLVK